MNSQNPYFYKVTQFLSIFSKKPLEFLAKTNEKTSTTRPQLGPQNRDTRGEEEKRPKFALATKRFRAIDLSCRACDACGAGAGCWAWIPGGGLRCAPFPPPTSDVDVC